MNMPVITNKPSVYMETSVISYLTNRPSRDAIVLGRQLLTRQWWDERRDSYRVFVSDFVIEEISEGHADAIARRVAALQGLPLLDNKVHEIETLANRLIADKALPATAKLDALHIAICAYHQVNYLASWNFSHIVNAQQLEKIERVCVAQGYNASRLVTLDQLM